MEIERYTNDEGEFRCFAVDNAKVSRRGMTMVVSQLPGVTITKSPRLFDNDVFCEFTYQGKRFIIEEPYGDSKTYDVAPESGLAAFEEMANFFEAATPIKGGDWPYNTMYLLRMVIAGLIFTGVVAWLSS